MTYLSMVHTGMTVAELKSALAHNVRLIVSDRFSSARVLDPNGSGKYVSCSMASQVTFAQWYAQSDSLAYPFKISDADETSDITISSEQELINVAHAIREEVSSMREGVRLLRVAIRNASSKQAAIDAYNLWRNS